MRLLRSIAVGITMSLVTTPSLLAGEYLFFDFTCDPIGLVRTRDQLVFSGRDPDVGENIVFACEGRSCINKQAWDDGSANTGIRVRYIYFPRGRLEFVSASASWRDGEDVPYHHVTYVTSLLPCGF